VACRDDLVPGDRRNGPGYAGHRLGWAEQQPLSIVRITLQVLLVITSLFLTLLSLVHKGRGGGLSDMFGGGASSSLGSSGVAERNLNRFTVAVGLTWTVVVVMLGVLQRFEA
jgi:preprotein translocase subunit SecG